MIGFWIIWPFEVLKNIAQADTPGSGKTNGDRFRWVIKQYGVMGFYRGILPGSMSIFMRNGAGFMAMQFIQKQLTSWGLRD